MIPRKTLAERQYLAAMSEDERERYGSDWTDADRIRLWSNPGDLVYSPFAGIGSEGYVAIREGRRFVGAELKESYWKINCANLSAAETAGKAQGQLFA